MTLFRMLRSKKGQSLIELMLIAPLMMALAYGALEVGSVISTYLTMSHTTREGASLASRGTPPESGSCRHSRGCRADAKHGAIRRSGESFIAELFPDPVNPGAAEPYNFIVDNASRRPTISCNRYSE